MHIETEVIDNVTYYTTVSRGVAYTFNKEVSGWGLHSHRMALGRFNTGSYRFFNTLQELENSLKAFKGVSQLIEA